MERKTNRQKQTSQKATLSTDVATTIPRNYAEKQTKQMTDDNVIVIKNTACNR